MVATIGYALNSFVAAFPEAEPVLKQALTPRGLDFLNKTRYECADEVILKFQFRHLQTYFNQDIRQMFAAEPVRSMLGSQRLGSLTPTAPVNIDINRFDPLNPWVGARQLAADWCEKGADVEFWTNQQPPFLNKVAVNHLVTYFVDGERGLRWIADRFNGLPTNPSCDRLPPFELPGG